MEVKDIIQEMRFAREASEARLERANRRLWIVVLVLAILFFASNVAWIVTDYNYTSEEQVIEANQDGYGTNLVGGGDITYGTESENHNR